MRKSEPKPKIIYRKIEDLIRSSSLRIKIHNQQQENQKVTSKINQNLQKREVLGERDQNAHSQNKLKKSLSKHSLKSKQKIKISDIFMDHALQQSEKQFEEECFHKEIDVIYAELQQFFQVSKKQFTQKLENRQFIDKQINELEQMSDYIKHIVQFYINNDQNKKPNTFKSQKKMICTQISEDYMLASMSKQNKLRSNKRRQTLTNRNQTVYEMILLQKERKLNRKDIMRR